MLTIDRELEILLENPTADRATLAALFRSTSIVEARRRLATVRTVALLAVMLVVPLAPALAGVSLLAAFVVTLFGLPLAILGAMLAAERLVAQP